MSRFLVVASCAALTSCAVGTPPRASLESGQAIASTDGSCGANDYAYLVGHPAVEAREINRSYRLISRRDAEQDARRVTVVFSPNSQMITEVRCG